MLSVSDIIVGLKKSLLIVGSIIPAMFYGLSNGSFSATLLRNYSSKIYNIVLMKNVEQHITLPIGYTIVIIKTTGTCYSKVGISTIRASIPSSNIINGTGSDLNIPGYILSTTNTTISLIAPLDTIVSLAFFAQ